MVTFQVRTFGTFLGKGYEHRWCFFFSRFISNLATHFLRSFSHPNWDPLLGCGSLGGFYVTPGSTSCQSIKKKVGGLSMTVSGHGMLLVWNHGILWNLVLKHRRSSTSRNRAKLWMPKRPCQESPSQIFASCHFKNLNLLTSIDIYWHLLTSVDIYWHLLTSIDINWHLLTSIDIYWHLLNSIDIYWHLLTSIDIYWHLSTQKTHDKKKQT